MKKIAIAFVFLFFYNTHYAQTVIQQNPYPKTISVSGSASMEIIPDEIYVNVELREYKKKGEDKTELEKIISEFLSACKTVGIADSLISIVSFEGNNYGNFYRRRSKDPDLMASIKYQIKFSDSKSIGALAEKLNDEATLSFKIVYTDHSKMIDFRRQLKIQAIKAAKEKGIYLTEAIGEKLGEAITIEENVEDYSNRIRREYENVAQYAQSNFSYMRDGNDIDAIDYRIDYRKIKIRFEVRIVFALK